MEMQAELIPWLIAAASLLLGCWVQTALGFGMAVIAAPIIVLVHAEWVPVTLTITALSLSIFNTWNQRNHLHLQEMLGPLVFRVPGTVAGAWLLTLLDQAALQIAVALCVLLAVVISYYGKQFQYSFKRLSIAAFISGIMGTTTSIGGPPMALVMQHGNPATVRANLSFYFSYSCILSLLGYSYIGRLNTEIVITSLSFLPCCILGFLAGIRMRPFVDAGRFRVLLLGLCGTAGLIALLGAVLPG